MKKYKHPLDIPWWDDEVVNYTATQHSVRDAVTQATQHSALDALPKGELEEFNNNKEGKPCQKESKRPIK